MANSSTTTTSCSILLLILLSSLHVHARESRFFSKVTNNNNAKVTIPTITPQVIPTKEDDPLNKPDQQYPNIVPQDNQNTGNYGLYGHESGQLPPYTATEKEAQGVVYHEDNRQYYPTTSNENNNNNNNIPHYYNNEAYVTEPQGISDTRFMQKPYTNPTLNFNDNYYNEGNNIYNNNNNKRQQGLGEAQFGATSGDMYNTEKKGMSDTRFLENGKYFYDLNNENNYNNNLNAKYHGNSRGFESRNQYYNNNNNNNMMGSYGNSFGSKGEYYNNNGQYGNNENTFEENNYSNEGYDQSQYQAFQDNNQNEQYQP